MEMHYYGALIRPIVTQAEGIFNSSVVIRDSSSGRQQYHETIGRFASDNAATLFAVNWAIARLEGKPEPRPPFKTH
jgi:hypothetical protein